MLITISVHKRLCNAILIILAFCASTSSIVLGQTRDEDLNKLKELKSSKNFNPESETYIDLLIRLGEDSYLYKPDNTEIYINEAYEFSKKFNYLEGQCRALNALGNYYTNKGNLKKAYKNLNESLITANKHNLKQEKIDALNCIGLALWQEGKNGLALSKFMEALPIAEEIKDVFMMGALNDNIALLYDDNKDYDTALLFNEKSRQISIDNNLEIALAQTLLNMAVMYKKQEKYVLANKTVDECMLIFEKTDDFDWLAYSYQEKGSIQLEQHNYEVAEEWFSKALKIYDEIDLTIGYARTYMGMARTNLGLLNIEKAENYGLKALKVSEELKVFNNTVESNLVLSQIYHAKGDQLKAYEYLTKYLELFKKSSAEDYQKGLGVLRSEIKFEEQKKLLIEENKSAIAQQRLYIFGAFAALLVLGTFLILLYRTHKIQKKYNHRLKKKQTELIKHETELQEANDTKDKLFSVIAHDLRGPINSLQALIKLYVDDSLSKVEVDMILPKALHDINGISDMLNNLLVWARTQMSGSMIKPSNLNLETLVNENIKLLNPLAEKKNITLTSTIPTNMISFSDRDHIDIVLRNLLSNAIKFTNEKGEVTISAIELTDKYQIKVKDNGIGMSIEAQTKLFDKNNTKSTYGTNNEKGTGLGLSLSKEMVESNGGKIGVDSKLNEGTTFFFTVPLKS
jgi:signal transduction histidine kinase